jgi:hypothetical protein
MTYTDPINIMNLPTWIATALNVDSLTANLLCFVLIMAILFVPMFLLKTNNYIFIIASILTMSFLTAMGILPFFVWPMLGLYMAINIAQKRWF